MISIHALREESDRISDFRFLCLLISIHALREESDCISWSFQCFNNKFQSTLSVRRATRRQKIRRKPSSFQSTLSVRRATEWPYILRRGDYQFQSTLSVRRATPTEKSSVSIKGISIHALREESDFKISFLIHIYITISIHALREESDYEWINYITKFTQRFQSTLSVRRATGWWAEALRLTSEFQSTLSVRRATICTLENALSNAYISIHALREESDIWLRLLSKQLKQFQSTLSVRRATSSSLCATFVALFQSTLSVRRATIWQVNCLEVLEFQSTLSVRRATSGVTAYNSPFTNFNPRSPWGERLGISLQVAKLNIISIHALREESDIFNYFYYCNNNKFQSTLSVRRATSPCSARPNAHRNFNPRSPWGERLDIQEHCSVIIGISIHALREESDSPAALACIRRSNFNPRSPWGERRPPLCNRS